MNENLRIAILGDTAGIQSSLDSVVGMAQDSTERIGSAFKKVGSVIIGALGVAGIGYALDQSVNLAGQQQSLQSIQAQLLKNQGLIGSNFAGILSTVAGTTGAAGDNAQKYSASLDNQATQISILTGQSKNMVIQSQNLLLPNKALIPLYKSQSGSFKEITQTATNLAAVVGTGVVGAAKMLGRTLADPASKMGSMTRYGVSLNKTQQTQIKNLEGANNLIGAQKQLLADINAQVQQSANKSLSPVAKMQNDLQVIMQEIGKGLLPILDEMATELTAAIQPLMPMFNAFSTTIAKISQAIGGSLGKIFVAFTPLFKLFTGGVLTSVLTVVAPIVGFIAKIADLISNSFKAGPLQEIVGIMTKMADVVVKAMQPGLKAIMAVFQSMAKGTIPEFFKSIAQSLLIMAPVLPSLVQLFTQLLVAFMPVIQAALPTIAKMFQLFAELITKLTGPVNTVVKALTTMHGPIASLAKIMGVLAGVWFAKSLFLAPMEAAGKGLLGLITKMMRFKVLSSDTMNGMSSTQGNVFQKFLGGRTGFAKGQQDLLVRQLGKDFQDGKMTEGEYAGKMRETMLQGPVMKQGLAQQRMRSIPGIGKMLGGTNTSGLNAVLGPEQIDFKDPMLHLADTMEELGGTIRELRQAMRGNMNAFKTDTTKLDTQLKDNTDETQKSTAKVLEKDTGVAVAAEKDAIGDREVAAAETKNTIAIEAGSAEGGVGKGGFWKNIMGKLGGGMGGGVGGAGGMAEGAVAGEAGGALEGAAGGLMSGLGGMMMGGLPIIAMTLLPLIMQHWKAIKKVLLEVGKYTLGMLLDAWHGLEKAGEAVWTELKKWGPILLAFLAPMTLIFIKWHDTVAVFKDGFKDIEKGVDAMGALFVTTFVDIWDGIKTFFKEVEVGFLAVWNYIIDGLDATYTDITNVFADVWNLIVGLGNDIKKIGKSMWTPMWDGFKDAVNLIINAANKVSGLLGDLSFGLIKIPKIKDIGSHDPRKDGQHAVDSMRNHGGEVHHHNEMKLENGAVQINIKGGQTNEETGKMVEKHVTDAFTKLQSNLRAVGRG